MAKFNKERFKFSGAVDNERVNVNAGLGLLNSVSREMEVKNKNKVLDIPIAEIRENEYNLYVVDDVTSLMESIKDFGLKQFLDVIQNEDGTYRIITGHRRFAAIKQLHEQGIWKEDTIPCTITRLEDIDLPLNDDLKEKYSIITTNREQRNYTDADIFNEIRQLEIIYKELKEKGVNRILVGEDEDGNLVEKEIKGIKTRTLVAQDLNVSEALVARYKKVENQGTQAVVDALLDNKMSVLTATEIVNLEPEEQDEFIESMEQKGNEVITKEDLMDHKLEKKEESKNHEQMDEEYCTLCRKEWMDDVADINKKFNLQKEWNLTQKEYTQYKKAVNTIDKIAKKMK